MARIITLTSAQVANFAQANRTYNASDKKLYKKQAWTAVRNAFGIPADVKLGFDDNTYQLYIKGTNPRVYLKDGTDGKYSAANTTSNHAPATAVPIPDQTAAANTPAPTPADSTTIDLAGVQALLKALEANGSRTVQLTIQVTSNPLASLAEAFTQD